jgi:hypothetical protein
LELLNGSSDQAGFSDVFHFHEELPAFPSNREVESKINLTAPDLLIFPPAFEAGKWHLLQDVSESLPDLRF